MKRAPRHRYTIFVFSIAALAVCFVNATFAGNTWDGGGGDDNWGTGANWNPDGAPAPGSGNDIFFGGTTRLTPNNNYTAFDDWRSIYFNSGAGAFTLNGNAIDLFFKIENNSTTLQTVNLSAISLVGTANELNPTLGDLTITSANIFTNGNAVHVYGGGGHTLTFGPSTIMSGSSALIDETNNIIVMQSAMAYTGNTFILNGKLQFTSTGSANSSTIRLGDTAANSNSPTIDLITLTGGTTINSTINPRAGTSGTLSFNSQNTSGTNTYGGHFGLDHDFTITQAAGTGTLNITQAHTDGGTNGTGYDIKDYLATFTPGAGSTINVTGDIYTGSTPNAGTGRVLMNGAGTLSLTGTANTYTGTTTISNGTLSANKIVVSSGNSSLGNATSAVILGGASTAGTLSYTGGIASYTRGFTVNAGGGGLTNAGTGLLTLITGGNGISIASGGTLTFATNGNGITNTSMIMSGLGSAALNSTGAGALTLTAANTYSGGTTLTQGTLALGSSSTITTGTLTSGPVGIGTFRIGSGTNSANVQTNVTSGTVRTLNNNISLDGDATFSTSAASGAITFDTIGTLTTPNSITLTRTNQLTVNTSVTLQLGGLVQGVGFGFTKLGAGTINLGGGSSAPADNTSNTYSGLTTITAGTVNLNKGTNGVTAIAGDILINGGALAYGTARDEQIADSAKLTITSGSYAVGAQTETIGQVATATSGLSLSGTGAITIGSGSLVVANSDVMTGGTVTLTAASGSFRANTEFNFSGGTIDFQSASGSSTAALNLRGGTGTGITYSASGTSTAQITNSGGGTAKVSLNTSGTTVFNIADAPSVATEMSIAPSITGSTALQKSGAGVLLLTGNNIFTGATTINAGTLNAGGTGALGATSGITVNSGGTLLLSNSGTNNHINNAATMTLNGGTFNTGGVSENGSVGIGALTLSASSIIDMASGASIINFARSNSTLLDTVAWSGTLSIWNWSGTPITGGGTDQLIFGSDLTGLSATQLSAIQFYSDAGTTLYGGGTAIILSNGEVVPVPEPSTWVAGGLALSALLVTQRRRISRLLKRAA